MSMYRAGISLMLSLVAMAGLFILLEADLLAVIQIMMNVGGMLVMTLFMVMLMMDPGGEMMWDMKRRMRMKGFAALSMSMPPELPAEKSFERNGALSPPSNPNGQNDSQVRLEDIAINSDWQEENEEEKEMAEKDNEHENEMMSGNGTGTNGAGGDDGELFRRMHEMQRAIAIIQQQLGLLQQQLVELQQDLLLTPGSGGQSRTGQGSSSTERSSSTENSGGMATYLHSPSPLMGQSAWQGQPRPGQAANSPNPTVYTCPMHPEIRQPNPGRCPKCGMDLVPAEGEEIAEGEGNNVAASTSPASKTAPASASAATLYTCPMHPEVRQPGPGRCPKCGIDLVPEGGDGGESENNGGGPGNNQGAGQERTSHSSHGDRNNQVQGGHRQDHGQMMHSSGKGGGEVETAEQMQKRSPKAYYRMMEGMAMSTRQLPLAGLFSILAGLLLVGLVLLVAWPSRPAAPDLDGPSRVGDLLLSNYMIAFEGAAFLILAGILGAVLLARRERERKKRGKGNGSIAGEQLNQEVQ